MSLLLLIAGAALFGSADPCAATDSLARTRQHQLRQMIEHATPALWDAAGIGAVEPGMVAVETDAAVCTRLAAEAAGRDPLRAVLRLGQSGYALTTAGDARGPTQWAFYDRELQRRGAVVVRLY